MKRIAILAALMLVAGKLEAHTPEPVASLPLVQSWIKFSDPQEDAFVCQLMGPNDTSLVAAQTLDASVPSGGHRRYHHSAI
jgi:hypothetical protein